MAGMSTRLSLSAADPGDYRGVSANLSGAGFADMHFVARAVEPQAFTAWVDHNQGLGSPLAHDSYRELAKPSQDTAVQMFAPVEPGLYDVIVDQYMGPHNLATTETMP
jgi:cytochrome o ubiquinol oxidase subunit 2